MEYKHTVAERFMRYVQVYTTSDPNATSFPSSERQKDLGRILLQELKDLGVQDAEMDQWGYVFGTVKGNTTNQVPVICFCAHMDTAPDVSGENVKPILHRKYDGKPITLPDDTTQVITVDQHPYLKEKIGDDLITASGLTLLGADDKAGVAIIMDFVQYLMGNPGIKHGDIRILFTPDEEVGRGVEQLDMKKLNADYGYTMDGGVLGSIEDESFSADAVKITVHGVSAHPGYAKGILVNALKVGGEILASLPKDSWSPETTEDRQGFVHPTSFNGIQEKATISFIIRDHITAKLTEYENRLKGIAEEIIAKHPGAKMDFEIIEQYRNMKEVISTVPFVTDYAIQAMKNAGIEPRPVIIRGGTDGSRLSFMGLPCPNLFTGEMGIHSRHEYVSVQDMEKAVATMNELVQIWEQHK
ncbi:MAG: peptidase T [Brumimicrobium sp.]|nr:peptidase T [Brumimicrobium sp.]